jgi:hypothetical protein
VVASLIIPIFLWRHYVIDKGVFPQAMLEDIELTENGRATQKRAGILPYLALLGGIAMMALGSFLSSVN